MGDAAVSVLVKEVVGRLTSELIKEFGLLWGFKDDILSLKKDFIKIQAVLKDAEERHIRESAVELWLQSLKYATLELENVLDEISTEALLQRLHKERGIKYRVRAFFSSNHNKFMSRVRIAHKVKHIRRKLDDIASRRYKLNLTPLDFTSDVDDHGVEGEMPDRETSSLIHDSSSIFGRDEEVEMVTEQICNNGLGKYDNGEILVYGIWGGIGVGKTTLAQLVYDHERVKRDFPLRRWVYVSKNFKVKEILSKIMGETYECKFRPLDTLQSSIQDELRGKKFLIVLDDVWIEENEKPKWRMLSETLSCGEEGSIVVMTTRSQTTSKMTAKVPELQHQSGCLSEDNSWLLFSKFAFAQGREGGETSVLEPIGKEIVTRCEGLSLAVKTLGSLLWSKSSVNEWENVKRSVQWELQESNVLPALKLSYDNLPSHLKRCFAYCCLFPKGHEIDKDEVIQLWVSNGFIPPRGELDLYALGEESFNCLVWRSFFQVHEHLIYGYKMHDLMHDMARDVMKHDCLVMDPACKDVKIPNEVLHLSSSCPDFIFSTQMLRNLTQLRSILMLGRHINCESRISQIFNLVCLRVLYLPGIDLRTLPESICNLKLLKYLNLSHSKLVALPKSIIYLQNLQVLILFGCDKLRKLPEGLRYMRGLQHLDIDLCGLLQSMPIGVKELTSLRRLSRFQVGEESDSKIKDLGDLNRLEGKLAISGLENVEGLCEAKSANLKCKTNLSVLVLRWSKTNFEISESETVKYEEVLEGLEPSACLKELVIDCYMGKIISPSWMVSLRNLAEIIFSGCKKCEHIPALGRLPNIKIIRLEEMDSLKCFYDDEKNTTDMFLSLQELIIIKCPNLVSLPSNIPNIRVLHFYSCDKLLSLPDDIESFHHLRELNIYECEHLSRRYKKKKGEDWPKVSHIPIINIKTSTWFDDDTDEDEP